VHKITERHLTTLKAGRFEFVPEHQFVQYLLPCFVTYFLGLCKHPSARLIEKQKFMRFVDKLIASYEHTEYVQVLSTNIKALPNHIQQDDQQIRCNETFSGEVLEGLLNTYFNDNEVTHDFTRNMLLNFQESCKFEVASFSEYAAQGFTLSWHIQITMFLNRIFSIFYDLL
jgi:hypothetical protein